MSSRFDFKHFVSGSLGGIAATSVLHPFDLIKIRLSGHFNFVKHPILYWNITLDSAPFQRSKAYQQVNDGLALRPQYSSIWHMAKSIFQKDGTRGLYRGVTPNILGSGLSWGFYFFFYNSIKSYLNGGDPSKSLRVTQYLYCGMLSGSFTLLFTNPLWVAKTRLCLQYETQNSARIGMLRTISDLYRQNGFKGFYKGLIPGLFGTSHGAVQFLVYEKLKLWNAKRKSVDIRDKMDVFDIVAMSAASKVVAASSTYPYQVVRSRLQEQHRAYRGSMDVITSTWRFEGVRGFYKGLGPNLLKVTPACCITFYVYELTMHYLPKAIEKTYG